MKNINFDEIELFELNDSETTQINGGWVWFVIGVAVSVALCCVDDPKGFAEGFEAGKEAGSN